MNWLMLECLSHRWIIQYIFTCNLFHLNRIYKILTIPRVTWRVIHVEHDQLTILKHPCSSPVFDEAWLFVIVSGFFNLFLHIVAFRLSHSQKHAPSWSWSYGSFLGNQCLSPLTIWDRIPLKGGVLDTTLCDVCQWLATGRWFSGGTLVSSTNKTYRHNIAEILFKWCSTP